MRTQVPSRGRFNHTEAGLTILEVLISLGIIAFALSTLIGFQGGLQTARVKASEMNTVQCITRLLVDRLVASDASAIGDSVQMPWSVARYIDTVAGNHPPLQESGVAAADSVVDTGLVSQKTHLKDLKVYLEYYAGCKGSEAGVAGILDDPAIVATTDPNEWRALFKDPVFRAKYRLDPALPPSQQLEENDSFIVRLVMTWGDGQQMEICTAKRVEPTE